MAGAAVLLVLAVVLWPRRPPLTASACVPPAHRSTGGRAAGERGPRRDARLWPRRQHARAEHETQQVLDLLDALAPALRAGLAPPDALRAVPDVSVRPSSRGRRAGVVHGGEPGADDGGLLDELRAAADRGEPLGPVWRRLAHTMASADVALVASAWTLCDRLGSPLAPTISTVSRVVRQRQAAQRRLDSATAGPRASMLVLTALPAAGPLVALVVGIPPAELYATPAGGAALGAGVLLLMVGRWWCHRLIGSVMAPSAAPRRQRWAVLPPGDRGG